MNTTIDVVRTTLSQPDGIISYSAEKRTRNVPVRVTFLFHLTTFDTSHPMGWVITIGEGRSREDYVIEGLNNVLKAPYSRILKRRKSVRDAIATMSMAIRRQYGDVTYPIQFDLVVHR